MATFGSKPWVNPFPKIFASFFLGNIGQENVFHDILEQKNAFLGYKNEISFTIFYDKKTRFQAIKTKCLKNRKIDIFIKGLTQVVVQNWQVFQLFFQAIQVRKMTFFQRVQPMVLLQKWPFYHPFFLRQYRAGKCF